MANAHPIDVDADSVDEYSNITVPEKPIKQLISAGVAILCAFLLEHDVPFVAMDHLSTAVYNTCATLIGASIQQLISEAWPTARRRWTYNLPIVLLGLRNARKTDLKASAAVSALPGELFANGNDKFVKQCNFVSDLRRRMRELRPIDA